MATVTQGYTWTSGETVTPTKLNTTAAPTVVVADNEVTTSKILDGAVTNVKLATGIDASKLTTGTLPMARIADDAVTNAKLATGIDASKLTTGTLPIARIADDAVTNDKLSLAANAGEIKKALNADNDPPIFACRAWVNFDGTAGSTVDGEFRCTIRASGNVSKVVRTATGTFVVHFSTAMPDANYCFSGGTTGVATTNASRTVLLSGTDTDGATNKTSSSVTIVVGSSSSGVLVNMKETSFAAFR
jgi:hypothetical protein